MHQKRIILLQCKPNVIIIIVLSEIRSPCLKCQNRDPMFLVEVNLFTRLLSPEYRNAK